MKINGREIKTVAVDFDGTLFVEEYPEIGRPIWSTIEYVKNLKAQGVELILYTNREGSLLQHAIAACKTVGITFDAINENLAWRVDEWGQSRKIGADLYIDDKSMNPRDIKGNFVSLLAGKDYSYWQTYYNNPYFHKCVDAINDGADVLDVIKAFCDALSGYVDEQTRNILENPSRINWEVFNDRSTDR